MNAFVIIRKYIKEVDKTIDFEMSQKNQQFENLINKKIPREQFGEWIGYIKGLQAARKMLDEQLTIYQKNGGEPT